MDKSGGAEGNRGNRQLKTPAKEDRISSLPDSLIHHIYSFLPSTKDAIRTGVLSKRWLHQWTRVPSLIFDFSGMRDIYGLSPRNCYNYESEKTCRITSNVSRYIDRTLLLHGCSKLHKFHIISNSYYNFAQDPNYDAKLYFAIRKQVEELVLKFSMDPKFRLPNFFFRQDSLVNLCLHNCAVMPMEMVYWGNLKDLHLENCIYSDQAVGSILSGSPLLQSLEMRGPYRLKPLVISSQSLKRLVLVDIGCHVHLSCPNLVELEAAASKLQSLGSSDEALEKFLLDSPLLESLIFKIYEFPNLRICSKILKKLALKGVKSTEIEISCPHLEELELCGLDVGTIRLMNFPCSISVALDPDVSYKGCKESVAKQILEQLQHVKDLKLGSSFVGLLSDLEMSGQSCPLVNGKSLTLEGTSFEHMPGIVSALCSLPVLESLVVMLKSDKSQNPSNCLDMDDLEGNYWDDTHLSSLVSHLRIVKIMGFSKREVKPKLVLDFIEFLLKNATVLEKMVVILEDYGSDFVTEVSQKVCSFRRCSNATVELLCSKLLGMSNYVYIMSSWYWE